MRLFGAIGLGSAIAIVVLVACVGDDPAPGAPPAEAGSAAAGEYGGPCLSGKTCRAGLVCAQDIVCLLPGETSTEAGVPPGDSGSNESVDAADGEASTHCQGHRPNPAGPAVDCPLRSGPSPCNGNMPLCCPATPDHPGACVPTQCPTAQEPWQCLSSEQCSAGSICCVVGVLSLGPAGSCAERGLDVSPARGAICSSLTQCTDPSRVRLCPRVGARDGCLNNETCKEVRATVNGQTLFLRACINQ